MNRYERIVEAKRRVEEALRSHRISGRENAELMADVAVDAAFPVLMDPRLAPTPGAGKLPLDSVEREPTEGESYAAKVSGGSSDDEGNAARAAAGTTLEADGLGTVPSPRSSDDAVHDRSTGLKCWCGETHDIDDQGWWRDFDAGKNPGEGSRDDVTDTRVTPDGYVGALMQTDIGTPATGPGTPWQGQHHYFATVLLKSGVLNDLIEAREAVSAPAELDQWTLGVINMARQVASYNLGMEELRQALILFDRSRSADEQEGSQ